MSLAPKAYWLGLTEGRILEILAQQGAATKRELEARLSEPQNDAQPLHPHIITTTLRRLRLRGEIELTPPTRTRGRRAVEVYHLPIVLRKNKRAITEASARKRLLQARYLSWAETSVRHEHGLLGPAGNLALHMALTSSECAGLYALIRDDGLDVTHLFGHPVPGGALDSAGVAVGRRGGVPDRPVTAIFEVKNLRHWIYPGNHELYQLLLKAALLQRDNPGDLIAPVLVTRRRHYWTFEMGVDLGFFTIEIRDQPMLRSADVTEADFQEVRTELGYSTLQWLDAPPSLLVAALRDGLPPHVLRTAERWRSHGSTLLDHHLTLRDEELSVNDRSEALADLGGAASALPDMSLRWRPKERPEEEWEFLSPADEGIGEEW